MSKMTKTEQEVVDGIKDGGKLLLNKKGYYYFMDTPYIITEVKKTVPRCACDAQ